MQLEDQEPIMQVFSKININQAILNNYKQADKHDDEIK
jgi:hypothetical protein